MVVEEHHKSNTKNLKLIKGSKVEVIASDVFIFVPFQQLLDLGMMREVWTNYWGDVVRIVTAIAFMILNKQNKTRLEFSKQQLSLMIAG